MNRRSVSGFVAAVVVVATAAVGLPSAHAAAPVERTAAEAYSDLMAIQAATRSGWTSGYQLRAHGSAEGGWSWTETFDAASRTIMWKPSGGPARLCTPSTTYVAIPDTARAHAIRRLVGRPQAVWIAVRSAGSSDYRFSLGHDFDTFRADDTDPAPNKDVAESATVTTEADGTRHWVVRSHRWWGINLVPNPDMLLTTDPRGRLVATSRGTIDGTTISYAPPTVHLPSTSTYIEDSTYSHADAAVTLRHRARRAARSVVAAVELRAAAEHRKVTVAMVRSETRRVVGALPASLVPVARRKARAGAELYGWNRFTRTWVVYRVRADGGQATVTRVR